MASSGEKKKDVPNAKYYARQETLHMAKVYKKESQATTEVEDDVNDDCSNNECEVCDCAQWYKFYWYIFYSYLNQNGKKSMNTQLTIFNFYQRTLSFILYTMFFH